MVKKCKVFFPCWTQTQVKQHIDMVLLCWSGYHSLQGPKSYSSLLPGFLTKHSTGARGRLGERARRELSYRRRNLTIKCCARPIDGNNTCLSSQRGTCSWQPLSAILIHGKVEGFVWLVLILLINEN